MRIGARKLLTAAWIIALGILFGAAQAHACPWVSQIILNPDPSCLCHSRQATIVTGYSPEDGDWPWDNKTWMYRIKKEGATELIASGTNTVGALNIPATWFTEPGVYEIQAAAQGQEPEEPGDTGYRTDELLWSAWQSFSVVGVEIKAENGLDDPGKFLCVDDTVKF